MARPGSATDSSMPRLPDRLDSKSLVGETREFWAARGLPAPSRERSYPAGSVTLLVGAVPFEAALPVPDLARLVIADVAARYLRLTGTPARQTLYVLPGAAPGEEAEILSELDHYGVWFGRSDLCATRRPQSAATLERRLGALAATGRLRAGAAPVPACPRCGEVRGPDRMRHAEELRAGSLVRFALADADPPLAAVVATDALWKLLGTEAILIHPSRPYLRVRFDRREGSEELLVSRKGLERLRPRLPNGRFEILEERPGAEWAGRRYAHPLRNEMPALGDLPAPAGTLLGTLEVDDRGTGLAPLVPAHGPMDAVVARKLGLLARPILGATGNLLDEPRHKYSGLPRDTAESFLERDLTEDGRILCDFPERCGVPRCLTCGTALEWVPSREWFLDLSQFGPGPRAIFARLLPGQPFPDREEMPRWPVTTGQRSVTPLDPELMECPTCGRLGPPPGPPGCDCAGAPATPVRRRLTADFEEALVRWAESTPLPVNGPLWLILPRRRLRPQLLRELAAAEASGARPTDLRLLVVETIPPEGSDEGLTEPPPADAVRAALVRLASGPPTRQTLSQAIVDETHRLHRVWQGSHPLLEQMEAHRGEADSRGIAPHLAELLPEDRVFLAAFERMRLEVLRAYDRGAWSEGYDTLARFQIGPFRDQYLSLVAARKPAGGAGPATLFQVLHHVLPRMAELGAPVVPHVAEAIHRVVTEDGSSVFDGRFSPIVESALDPKAEATLYRWGRTVRAVREARRRFRIPPAAVPIQAVVVVRESADAEQIRAEKEILGRLLGGCRVTIASPEQPWMGRRVEVRWNSEEIQRAYPAYHRRILSVLQQFEPRRVREALRNQTLAVAIEGQPAVKISPAMVDLSETLPDGFVEVAGGPTELYLEFPAGALGPRPPASPLSPNAARVARHVDRRLRRAGPDRDRPSKLFLWAEEPYRAELLRAVPHLSRELGIASVLVTDTARPFRPSETTHGRFPRGDRFQVWIPGQSPVRRREKRRVRRAAAEPPFPSVLPAASPGDADYLSEEQTARSDGIRSLLAELDGAVGRPMMGPAKLGIAWDHGFQSPTAFAEGDPLRIAELPGFGPLLTRELLGRLMPDRPAPVFPAATRRHDPEPPPVRPEVEEAADPDEPPRGAPPDSTVPAAGRPRDSALPLAPGAMPSDRAGATLPAEGIGGDPASEGRAPFRPAPPTIPSDPAPPPAAEPLRAVAPNDGAPRPTSPVPESTPLPAEPPAGPTAGPTAAPPPAPVGVEIRVGADRQDSWERFLAALDGGTPGLWIGRLFPRALAAGAGAAEVRFLWLATSGRPNSVAPSDLDGILAAVGTAVREGSVRVVILEEVEYLAALHGAPAIRAFLGRLDAWARAGAVRVYVPLVPELLGPDPSTILRFAEDAPTPGTP